MSPCVDRTAGPPASGSTHQDNLPGRCICTRSQAAEVDAGGKPRCIPGESVKPGILRTFEQNPSQTPRGIQQLTAEITPPGQLVFQNHPPEADSAQFARDGGRDGQQSSFFLDSRRSAPLSEGPMSSPFSPASRQQESSASRSSQTAGSQNFGSQSILPCPASRPSHPRKKPSPRIPHSHRSRRAYCSRGSC